MNAQIIFQVSDFVEVFNQTLDYTYNNIVIRGEIANYKISKGKWVYFDLKDEFSSVKFFGSIYGLPGPLQNGMLVLVNGTPRLHNLYGFSVNFKSIKMVGEGSIQKASELLRIKLKNEGLFEVARKRIIPTIPQNIGLITSAESAAFGDFIKILNNRWSGLNIQLYNVGVQGFEAIEQNLMAINYFNQSTQIPDLLVITRGGGSKDDLSVYDDERIVRAVANSKIPTLVAIGHEIDVSLAELVADKRASTPSNAAEILVPDKSDELNKLNNQKIILNNLLSSNITNKITVNADLKKQLINILSNILKLRVRDLKNYKDILNALDPKQVINRGFVILRSNNTIITSVRGLKIDQNIMAELKDGELSLNIKDIQVK